MKRITSLFLLLMAMIAPLAMTAQQTNTLLTEGFESSTLNTTYQDYAWYSYNAGSGNNWQFGTMDYHNGSKSAYYAYNSSNAANCYMVSMPFNVNVNMTNLSVSLYEKVAGSSYPETFEVFFVKASDVSTLEDVASATQYSAIASDSYTNTSWAEKTGSTTNSALAGQSVRVVVHCTSAKNMYRLYIDDLTVTETVAVSCPTPTLGDAEYITAEGASFQWTENGTANSWVLQYSTDENFTNATSVNRTGIPSYAITGLNGGTTYYVRVKSNCGGGDESDWSNVVSFTTEVSCLAPTDLVVSNITARGANLSWNGSSYSYIVEIADPSAAMSSSTEEVLSEGFEGGSLPTGWTKEGNGTWTVGSGDYHTTTGTHSGTYNALIKHGTTGNETYLVTPAMDLSSYANAKLTCWYVNRSWSGDIDGFGVYYRTSSTGAWTELFSTTSAHSSWTQTDELSLPSEAFVQIGFKYTDNYGYGVGLDDIVINANPLQLTWNTVDNNVSTTSYTLSGLNPETAYMVRVTGDCGMDGLSFPSEVVSFTTEAACPAPTALNATNVLLTSATLSWEGDAESYEMEYANLGASGASVSTFDFEDGTLQGWTNLIVEADGGQWLHSNNNPAGYDYTGRAHGGTGFALSFSFVDNPDAKFDPGRYNTNVYLVSPQSYQINEGASLTFWYNYANSSYADNMEVCVATAANPTASDFTSIWSSSTVGTWTEVNLPLNAYSGQTIWIAFHHEDYDMYEVWVDDITIDAGTSVTWIPVDGTVTSPYTLNGLTSETEYAVHVRANCGADGMSAWSTSVIFTTASACDAPTELNATNITAASATLNWTGVQENFNVRYGKVFYEGFENGIPSTWTTIDSDGDGNNWFALSEISTLYPNGNYPSLSGWGHNGSDAATSASYINNYGSFDANNWLITPQVDLAGTLEFYVTSTYEDLDSYEVLLSTNGTETTDFTIILQDMTTASYGSWDVVSLNLDAYEGQQGYIAIHHVSSNMYFLVVDDFGIYYEMQTTTATESPITINQLDPNSDYAWQVQGLDCDGEGSTTEWSDMASFTTPFGLTREIVGYGTGDGGYCLIASPVEEDITPSASNGFITNAYDLYMFDQTGDGNGNEWINFRPNGSFDIVNGLGYLYASSTTTTLIFTGTPVEGPTHEVSLVKDDDSDFAGMNLVGNPFTEIAYIQDGRPFYTMNGAGTQIVAATSNSIEAMEGVFVLADTDEEAMIFTTEMPAKSAQLALNLSDNNSLVDRAIIRFGESRQLTKFQFNSNSTKLYIPKDNHDYAVVSSEEVGEMPVNFKAQINGTYTISISAEEIEFGYLHLIDNMTGDDIDLLATPSYSFTANTTDNANRFKLVFATGTLSIEENFAYFNNGSFVINNEGAATMQVIDINGRILSSESINGDANININAAAGVYMIRLVNGDNVRVQKVIVR